MNHLQHETSPYLLQHAHNPVDWYAWKPEAFERAKREDKPILVSIGYSTCHWCHVMERESFENEDIAAIMNANFINIKVDREERPDVDQIYMEACQVISGGGGWPLNCFLLPDGRPFYAGTYYPPHPAHGRPSWGQVLQNLSNAFKHQRETVEDQADKLTNIIKNSDGRLLGNAIEGLEPEQVFTPVILQDLYFNLHERFDRVYGGFGNAPKFPSTMSLEFLLNYHHFTGSQEAIEQVDLSLTKMIQGGIYDQIGGGFARYSVDTRWLVPHFEKMLYDNALLVGLLAEAYKHSPRQLYKDTIEETLLWVEREMTHKEGGFYSALDADSEGVEGKYYVWQKAEILEALGDFGELYCQFYDVSERGNWEKTNILNRKHDFEDFAHLNNIEEVKAFKDKIATANATLYKLRERRIRPGLDDKMLLDWNALMITAHAKAYQALGNLDFYKTAANALNFVLDKFSKQEEAGFYHTYKGGVAQYDAFLNDYAYLIEAMITMSETGFESHLLRRAEEVMDHVIQHFLDRESKLFYFTSDSQENLVARKRDIYDSAVPSGNAVMVHNLQKLGILLDREDYRMLAEEMLMHVRDAIAKYPSSFSKWSIALANKVYGWKEIAVVGANAHALAAEIQRMRIPNKVIMANAQESDEFPLLVGKTAEEDTYIYVCENFACQKPVKTIGEFKQLIQGF